MRERFFFFIEKLKWFLAITWVVLVVAFVLLADLFIYLFIQGDTE